MAIEGALKAGDRVRITGVRGAVSKDWIGLECEVSKDSLNPNNSPWLIPLTRRPDGRGLAGFVWASWRENLELLAPVPPKFKTVEEADAWLESH